MLGLGMSRPTRPRRAPSRSAARSSRQSGGFAGIVPWDLALDVPHMEAGDMEVYAPVLSAQPLHDHLRLRDGLAAAVAGLPVARTTPQLGNVVVRKPPIGKLVPNHAPKLGPVHE